MGGITKSCSISNAVSRLPLDKEVSKSSRLASCLLDLIDDPPEGLLWPDCALHVRRYR